MVPVPEHVPDRDLSELHAELVRTARRRPRRREDDAEDLAQEAWLREVVAPERSGSPALRTRLFRKLRDAGAERLRTSHDFDATPLHESVDVAIDDAAAVFELEQTVRAIAGDDAVEEARRRVARKTEAEQANEPGWDARRAGRARKALEGARNYLRETLRE